MQMIHINEDILDRYAMGDLSADSVPDVEEHLLECEACQLSLEQTDEFLHLLRLASSQVVVKPVPFWEKLLAFRPAPWAYAAALVVISLPVIGVLGRHAQEPDSEVLMRSLRGADIVALVPAGKPAHLVFDMSAPPASCRLKVLDHEGRSVSESGTSVRGGRIGGSVGKLAAGDYWVRLYCGDGNELTAEYGLKAK